MFNHKKSQAGIIIAVILITVLFIGWIINISQRECKTNKDCSSESYCGSDFSCHTYPTIQKTVVQYSLFWPAVIIGFAIIIAAMILKVYMPKPKEEKSEQFQEYKSNNIKIAEEAKTIEPYYKSESKTKI